jgi:predicted  nucleic acid-binding Zn-ribbon protein
MDPSDLTIEILKEIRDEVRQTNFRIDETNFRIEKTNLRIEKTNEGVDTGFADVARRIVESEIRTSTAIADLAGTVREMTSVLRAQHDLRPRVERCERDIAALQRRTGKE